MLLCFLITCFEIFKNWQIDHLEVNHLILKYLGNFVCLSVYCCCSVHCVWLFVTPWAAVHQASLSFTSLLKLMSFESVMLSNHLILCHPPSPPAFSLSQHQGLSNELAVGISWPKYWGFSFNISPSSEYSGFISFRIDWLDLLAVQGTLKCPLRHHSSKASFFSVQPSLWSNSHICTWLLDAIGI